MKSHLASPMSAEGYIVSPALTDFSPDEIITATEQDRSAGRRTVGQRFGPRVCGLAAFFGIAGPVLGASQADLQPALTQFSQEGSKLVGTFAVGLGEQGWSVALSADGNTAIVGGPFDNSNTGAAWVYTRRGDVWTQQGNKLVGSDAVGNARQGVSVALSADGNTAIVGGSADNADSGAAWVFTRSNGVWTQQRSKLVGIGAVGNAAQGFSIALSDDGNTTIVGGAFDNMNTGAAWVYTRSGDVWTQLGNKLVGASAVGNAGQGVSVALSADGSTAIVGGPFDNSNTGAAWVYTCRGAVWGTKLVGTGAVGNARQGVSVALSADGSTAIVGGVEDNSYIGAAWVYNHNGTVWTQQANKLVGTDATGSARQGHSSRCPLTARPPSLAGLPTTGSSERRGSTRAAAVFQLLRKLNFIRTAASRPH
jgi:antibiotic biosynthesis monooxygenase (ABM) superfamily enzyme